MVLGASLRIPHPHRTPPQNNETKHTSVPVEIEGEVRHSQGHYHTVAPPLLFPVCEVCEQSLGRDRVTRRQFEGRRQGSRVSTGDKNFNSGRERYVEVHVRLCAPVRLCRRRVFVRACVRASACVRLCA